MAYTKSLNGIHLEQLYLLVTAFCQSFGSFVSVLTISIIILWDFDPYFVQFFNGTLATSRYGFFAGTLEDPKDRVWYSNGIKASANDGTRRLNTAAA